MTRFRRKAQLLVIFAVGILAMLAFTGFAIDLAQYLVHRAHLRRAVDAAAMAAAGQFRSGYASVSEMKTSMERAAKETLALNGVQVSTMEIKTSVDKDAGGTPLCDDPVQDAATEPDKYLCFPRGRKKVWIKASAFVPTAFMRLFGIPHFTVYADAVGEAASLDLVLVLDISISMARDGTTPAQRDPSVCNQYPGDFSRGCLPFEYVRAAAKQFVQQILDLPCSDPTDPTQCLEQDRLAIVLFSTGWENDPSHYRGTFYLPASGGGPWFKRQSDALHALDNMKVYEPPLTCREWADGNLCEEWDGSTGNCITWRPEDEWQDPPPPGLCRCYGGNCFEEPEPDHSNYNAPSSAEASKGIMCMSYSQSQATSDPHDQGKVDTCTNTNIGGALALSSDVLINIKHDPRPDALWVTVLLTDGSTNATGPRPLECLVNPHVSCQGLGSDLSFGYCPDSTQHDISGNPALAEAWCRDLNTGGPGSRRTNPANSNFDADDYARYFADYLACPPSSVGPGTPAPPPPSGCATWGQGAYIYAIGMGSQVISTDTAEAGDPPPGGALLRYISAVGDDNDPTTDLCASVSDYSVDCGNYYYRQNAADIADVFNEIARRIFTRLSH